MSNLAFLLVAVGVSVVGVTVLVLRSRPPSSSSPQSSVEQFNEKMRALAPDPEIGTDDVDVRVVHGVERGEIALAGHAGDALHPLGDELVDENLAAGAGIGFGHDRTSQARAMRWQASLRLSSEAA